MNKIEFKKYTGDFESDKASRCDYHLCLCGNENNDKFYYAMKEYTSKGWVVTSRGEYIVAFCDLPLDAADLNKLLLSE